MANQITLTEQEMLFCDLYAHGETPFGGNAPRCFEEVFGDHTSRCKSNALRLLSEPRIQTYLKGLDELTYEEAKYMKTFLASNLMHIAEECSKMEYTDRRGTPLSPASLRSVAVSALKALMDLYPVKEAQETKVKIDGANGEGGITFNVIMPDTSKLTDKEGKEGEA